MEIEDLDVEEDSILDRADEIEATINIQSTVDEAAFTDEPVPSDLPPLPNEQVNYNEQDVLDADRSLSNICNELGNTKKISTLGSKNSTLEDDSVDTVDDLPASENNKNSLDSDDYEFIDALEHQNDELMTEDEENTNIPIVSIRKDILTICQRLR